MLRFANFPSTINSFVCAFACVTVFTRQMWIVVLCAFEANWRILRTQTHDYRYEHLSWKWGENLTRETASEWIRHAFGLIALSRLELDAYTSTCISVGCVSRLNAREWANELRVFFASHLECVFFFYFILQCLSQDKNQFYLRWLVVIRAVSVCAASEERENSEKETENAQPTLWHFLDWMSLSRVFFSISSFCVFFSAAFCHANEMKDRNKRS